MKINVLLGKLSSLLPESRMKTLLRRISYGLLRQARFGTEEIHFNGVSFRMHKYPLLGGTGFDKVAMAGYITHRDIQPGDIVVDAGAYTGDFALYASAKAGPTGKVIAFEPDPTSWAMLSSNVSLNRTDNITIVKKGLWSHDGEMRITGTAFASELTADSNNYSLKVPICSLDNELKRLDVVTVDFVKMDIEGAEIEALQGMEEMLTGQPTLAIASYHVRNGLGTSSSIESCLKKHGYITETEHPEHLTTYGTRASERTGTVNSNASLQVT